MKKIFETEITIFLDASNEKSAKSENHAQHSLTAESVSSSQLIESPRSPSEADLSNTDVQIHADPVSTHPQGCLSKLDDSYQPSLATNPAVDSAVDECITYCKAQNIDDPVEILRCAQKFILKGKPLHGYSGDPEEFNDSRSNFIVIDRHNVLETALEELNCLEDAQLAIEVSFYGESAQDAGGPRTEFFRLCLQEIKCKYFDKGLKEHLYEDYETVGLIMALSILQDGKIPRFLDENHLQEIFVNCNSNSKCLLNLSKGLNKLGLCSIAKNLPTFLYLLRPSAGPSSMTRRKLIHLLEPVFSEDGSNQRQNENLVYAAFTKYSREAAGGKRGNVTLEHILQFTTAADEEPVLGFVKKPSIHFTPATSESIWSFIPTANTCSNVLHLPCPETNMTLPSEKKLFEVYDMAFCNAYFGNQ